MKLKNEVYEMISKFFNENPNGIVTISYPKPFWDKNKFGVSFAKGKFKNKRLIQFKDNGIFIKETCGFSLMTGKHIFIPYNKIEGILFEKECD